MSKYSYVSIERLQKGVKVTGPVVPAGAPGYDGAMRTYKHVLIDADNTILNFAVCEKRILEDIAREFGFMPRTRDDEDLTTAYRRINTALWEALERGEIAAADLKIERFRQLSEVLDYTAISRPVAPEVLNQQFIARLSTCGEVVPTARAVLAAIAPVVVITNGFAEVQRSRFAASGLNEFISDLFISAEIGANKPDPAFFTHVLSHLGNPDPSECLVIGDSLTSDIAGGNAAGIDTVWFDRSRRRTALPGWWS
jgi:2-haloacid dehalogenase